MDFLHTDISSQQATLLAKKADSNPNPESLFLKQPWENTAKV